MGLPSQDMMNKSQWTTAPTKITLTGGAAVRSGALTVGKIYYVYATVESAFIQGDSAVTATADSVPLPAKTFVGPIYVDAAANQYVSVHSSSAGSAYLVPLES